MNVHNYTIKRTAIVFLQIAIMIVGLVVFTALLIEPQIEGRNTHSTLFQTYFTDPFLAYIYIASIPFFVALYQAFNVLRYARENKMLTQAAVKSIRIIKYCALVIAVSIILAIVYIKIAAQSSHDDPAGAIMLGIVISFLSVVVTVVASMFEKIVQNAVEIKSKN